MIGLGGGVAIGFQRNEKLAECQAVRGKYDAELCESGIPQHDETKNT